MRWSVVVALLGGCFTPTPPEGAPCGAGRICPKGQECSLVDDRCYVDPAPGVDASTSSPIDAAPASTCVPRRLLTGGMDVTAQGWTVERVGLGTITYSPATTTLSTEAGARQLIVLRDAFPPDRWSIQVVGEITRSGGCTQNNAAIALMASFHEPAGDANDRARMLCLSETSAEWGDGSSKIGIALNTTGVLELERVPSASIRATVQSGAGQTSMTANGFTSNGTLALGDQSTNLGLDSSIKILTVDLTCP